MSDILSNETASDIKASILIVLKDIALGQVTPQTIDQLTELFQGSGKETRREWVEKVANQMVITGFIAGGADPQRPIKPSQSYKRQVLAVEAERLFPDTQTSIELVPLASRDGSPHWRLVVWGSDGTHRHIKHVAESEYKSLSQVLKLVPWRIVWHAKVIGEAIRKLGTADQLGIVRAGGNNEAHGEGPELSLRVYEASIRAKIRCGENEDKVLEYDPRSCEWRAL